MKRLLNNGIIIVSTIVSALFVNSTVLAKNVYYTNNNEVQMTELEYNKMLKIFSERKVSDLSQEEFDKYKEANIISTEAVYQKETYKDDKVIKQEYISEEEFNTIPNSEASSGISPQASDSDLYETSYKRLAATLLDMGGKFNLLGTLAWKKIPAVTSYDVFAYRFMHFDYSGFTGSQVYYIGSNAYQINYSTSSEGYKAQSNGAGVSMNLKDGDNITGYELTVSTNLTVNTINYSQAHAYISYQHAQSDLTRAQSMSYTLDVSGLGNVVYFSNQSIRSKYDAMSGLHLSTPI